jgi:hypothetical protein
MRTSWLPSSDAVDCRRASLVAHSAFARLSIAAGAQRRNLAFRSPARGRQFTGGGSRPQNRPVLCTTRSLASGSGMWGEQMAIRPTPKPSSTPRAVLRLRLFKSSLSMEKRTSNLRSQSFNF